MFECFYVSDPKEEEKEEEKPAQNNILIIGVCVGVFVFIIVCLILLWLYKSYRKARKAKKAAKLLADAETAKIKADNAQYWEAIKAAKELEKIKISQLPPDEFEAYKKFKEMRDYEFQARRDEYPHHGLQVATLPEFLENKEKYLKQVEIDNLYALTAPQRAKEAAEAQIQRDAIRKAEEAAREAARDAARAAEYNALSPEGQKAYNDELKAKGAGMVKNMD
jgi:hypothetical protein